MAAQRPSLAAAASAWLMWAQVKQPELSSGISVFKSGPCTFKDLHLFTVPGVTFNDYGATGQNSYLCAASTLNPKPYTLSPNLFQKGRPGVGAFDCAGDPCVKIETWAQLWITAASYGTLGAGLAVMVTRPSQCTRVISRLDWSMSKRPQLGMQVLTRSCARQEHERQPRPHPRPRRPCGSAELQRGRAALRQRQRGPPGAGLPLRGHRCGHASGLALPVPPGAPPNPPPRAYPQPRVCCPGSSCTKC